MCVQVAVAVGMTLLVGKRMNLLIGIRIKGEESHEEVADMEVGIFLMRETTGN
jgi:hypothetical protein